MRIIQTRNDTIRLIFNPKTDGLCLSDFLIVRDGEDNFLGQIVEIYDDKFNAEENVATIRLAYRILADREIVPYDNFTPSRECEIAKIKLEEIEKCLNTDKETVPFGISTKNNKIVNINIDFFNNNPVIFADKLNEVNTAFNNVAQKLKAFKKVVVIDYTGNLDIQNAKRIKARDDFKLPLDYFSLEYIWNKALSQAPLEAQAELDDMFVELRKFANSTEDKYIPFPRFIKVIEQQYKATPALELKVLLNRLKRYASDEIFARSKKEFHGVLKTIQKENVTIIDLSSLKLEWHREFLEFAVRQANEFDAYLLLRLNENNSNPEIINDLYQKNSKLSIISSISYGFNKLPHVMEYARNYILYKTLNPRRDFGFANFQIASLNRNSFMVFGEDTMDFIFTLKNYIYKEEDLNKEEDKKIYIDLNLELEEMTSVELAGGDFELKNVHIQNSNKQRLSGEVALDDILTNEKEPEEETEEEFQDIPLIKEENKASELTADVEEETVPEPENPSYTLEEVGASSTDVAEDVSKEDEEDEASENETDMAELIEASLKNDEEYIKEMETKKAENIEPAESKEDTEEDSEDDNEGEVQAEIPLREEDLDYFTPDESETETEEEAEEEIITSEMIEDAARGEELIDELKNDETPDETLENNPPLKEDKEDVSLNDIKDEARSTLVNQIKEDIKTGVIEAKKASEIKNEPEADKQVMLQKEVKKPAVIKNETKEAVIIVKEKPNLQIDDFTDDKEEEKVSLKELAQKSIEARFDEVIDERRKPVSAKKDSLKINDTVSIDIDTLKHVSDTNKGTLPVFKNGEEDESNDFEFSEGMRVSHQKYGSGVILKVVKYSNRCLLQIEFDESGKRLLDPKIAKIQPV